MSPPRPLSALLLTAAFLAVAHPATRAQDAPSARQAGAARADTAVFAGGCFWCVEEFFDEVDGVLATVSGYAGGHVENPSYEQVTAGGTGHREAVQVIYDPREVGYERLLEAYWKNVDPLDAGGQFCDRGISYTTAIFAQDEEQARKAEASRAEISERLRALGHDEPVVTPVVTDADFYTAEDYHQDYYRDHPVQYRFYKWRCGRVARLDEVWEEGES